MGTHQDTIQNPNILCRAPAKADLSKPQKTIQSLEKGVGPENKVGPKNKVGPAHNFEIPEPSGSCGSIRLVKLVSTNTFSPCRHLSGYNMGGNN